MDADGHLGALAVAADQAGTRLEACRSCGGSRLEPVLSLGEVPIADRLLTEEELGEPDRLAPLDAVLCPDCALVQLDRTLPRELLFDQRYPYCSSVSAALVEHARANALQLTEALSLDSGSFVLEIGSNDGYMLRNFVEAGIPSLGVDPSSVPARLARRAGVPTLIEFFDRAVAERLVEERGRADLVVANNVLAHVGDLNGVVAGIATVLAPDGLATLEFPYVDDLIDGNEFDTIYHQHLCYFSMTALVELFDRHGLAIREVRRLDIHGGSLRIHAEPGRGHGETVRALLDAEAERGMARPSAYNGLAETARRVRASLRQMLSALKQEGRRIAAYGAAAKGTTLLAYCDIGPEVLDYVVDLNPFKQGCYLPGCRLEIRPPETLLEERPDHVLLLSWNFAEEILEQQAEYLRAGGRFIVPIPSPRVV